jgi:hypothetical protein
MSRLSVAGRHFADSHSLCLQIVVSRTSVHADCASPHDEHRWSWFEIKEPRNKIFFLYFTVPRLSKDEDAREAEDELFFFLWSD